MIDEATHDGSGKTISFWGGCQLLINNMAGPALVLIPSLYQESGFIPVSFFMILAAFLSGLCSWFLSESLKYIPGNRNYNLHAEYTSLINHYFDKKWQVYTVLSMYLLSLVSLLMSNIIQSSQVMDLAIRDMFGCSYGLSLYPSVLTFICGNNISDSVTPFTNDSIVISDGYILLAAICLIFSLNKNLDDSIILQWIANIGLSVLVVIWLYIFNTSDDFDMHRVSMFSVNLNNVVGILLFNFAFIVTVPSWINEKKANVSVINTLVLSLTFIVIIFTVVGIFGAFSYDHYFDTNSNLFSKLDEKGGTLGKATVYAFPIIQNVTSIPVFSIIIRYNLEDYGMNRKQSNLIAIVIPWVLSIFLYSGM